MEGVRISHQGLKAHSPEGAAGRITQAGLAARSAEGTAAKAMAIKGHEDLWVEIQANTFRNWINETLKPMNIKVVDLVEDLCDGTVLCALVEALQGRRLKGWSSNPTNQHHKLENVTTALQAIEDDGVKLVNIGNVDIVNGNLKLILGLIWSLIMRYQIGKSKFPPRKLMLSWLQAAMPECRVGNLTTDWNSGVLLSALLDYCKPGIFPHWKELNRHEAIENCRRAMKLAHRELDVPMVLEPEYLASPWLDELSGMTYLSYFMKPDSTGVKSTLDWVNSRLERPITNFTTDWNDGRVANELVRSMGGPAPHPSKLRRDPARWEENCQTAIDAGKKLGVQPVLSAKDMSQSDVEHLGVMAWAAQFRNVPPRPPVHDMLRVALDSTSGRVGEPTYIKVESISNELSMSDVKVSIVNPLEQESRLKLDSKGAGEFVPEHAGMHEIVLTVEDIRVDGRYFFRVLPRLVSVPPPGMAPCAAGSIVEVLVSATGAPRREDIDVTAHSPSGRAVPLEPRHPPPSAPGTTASSATFQPDEAGVWTIAITYKGEHIQGGPFTCEVFDPAGVRLSPGALEGANPLKPHSFELDTSGCGVKGDLQLDIVHDKRSVMCALEKLSSTKYRATFMPKAPGKHRLYIYFNGYDVHGSPHVFRVGSRSKKPRDSSSPSPAFARISSPVTRLRSESPHNNYNLYESNTKHTSSIDRREERRNSNDYYKSSFPPDIKEKTYDVTDSYSNSRLNKRENYMYDDSPRNRTASPITSKHLGNGSRLDFGRSSTESPYRASSPYRATSPIGRTSPLTRKDSPLNRTASPTYRVSSPTDRYSPVTTTKRVVEKRSNYKVYSSYSGSQDNLDQSSPLSSLETDRMKRYGSPSTADTGDPGGKPGGYRSKNDSWESIEKTRQMFSNNSLDSSGDRYGQNTLDRETQRNTQLNKFSDYSRDSFNKHLDRLVDEADSDTYTSRQEITKREVRESSYVVRDSSYSSVEEKHQQQQQSFLSNRPPRDPTGGAFTETDAAHARFRSVQRDNNRGARGIVIKPTYKGVLGQPVEFIVDASAAGPGQLELEVSGGNGTLVASSVRPLGGNKYVASFTPRVLRAHSVRVTFNDEHVFGSPWKVEVMAGPAGGGGGEPTRLIPARVPAVFEISTSPGAPTFNKNEVGVTVTAPSRRPVTARVLDVSERPGVYRIEFTPEEVGTHLIDVSIGDDKLAAGPLVAKVYDASLIKVTDVGNALVGQQCQFRVDASAAGEGQLEISINEGEVPNHVQVVGGGRCLVFWRPETPTPHRVDIKFNGEPVPSSPFIFHVAPAQRVTIDTSQVELIPVGEVASCSVRVEGSGGGELTVTVRGPRGEVPVRLTGEALTGLVASFTPKHVGPHTLTAHYNNQPVPGTPFVCKAYDSKLVSVNGGSSARIGVPVQLAVDAAQAGEGNLEITVAARGLNIPTQVHPQGNARFTVSFTPTEACEHIVNVSFNKMRVPGCPLIINVSEGGGIGARVTLPGPVPLHQPASLTLHHSAATLDQIEVNVEGPNGASVPAAVAATGAGTFRAEFVPRAVGEHRLNVLVDSAPIPASPFHLKVYDVTAIRVKDVTHGTVGKPVTFLVETMAAGPGNLEVTVNGGRVPTAAAAQGAHTYAISFTPRDPRPHTVELRFNGDHVPGSPFVCHVSAPARVIGAGSGESPDKVSVGDAYTFSVDSPTSPHVEVLGPARRPVAVQVSAEETVGENEPSKRYTISFVPVDVGDHSIEVRAGAMGGHVEGSPFLVKAYSASRVSVTDISPGVVGRPVAFTINASHAGAGNLEIIVAVNGRNVPNYVQSEGNARFKVNFKPTEAAPHTLSVRFNGHAVPGSPFTCIVSAPAAAADARAAGPGLSSAPRGEPAEIHLTGFHTGDPTIFVTGPGGSSVRARVTPTGDGRYTGSYTPDAVGRHSVQVQCAGRPVPGSPFTCNVYDVRRVRVTGLGAGELEGTLEGLSLDESGDEERGVEVGKPVTFSVDAAGAGEGTLELVVSTPSTTVKAEVVAVARGLYDVTFVPVSREPHRVSVTFNEQPVPGSPFVCRVSEPHTYVQIGGVAAIEVDESLSDVEVLSPTGSRISEANLEDTGLLTFPANRVGRYLVKSPRGPIAEVEALDAAAVKVLSIGDAVAHRPAILTVSTAGAGAGRLSARVWCGGTAVAHSVRRRGGARMELVWHPSRAATHRLALLWSGVPISKEPLIVDVLPAHHGQEVSASGLGLYQAQVGKVASFSIDTLGRPAREFDVVVSGPGSRALPVRCYQTKSGLLQAEFAINEIGQSTIEVLHLSKPVTGSPFTCESFDPHKVILSGLPTGNIIAQTPINFTVDTKDAGLGELEVVCEAMGDRRVRLPIDIREDGHTHKIRLRPSVPAHYRIYITYGGAPVVGSPVSLGVLSGKASNAAKCLGTGLAHAHVGKEAAFTIHCVEDTAPTVQVEKLTDLKEETTDSGLLECRVAAGAPREWLCAYIPLVVGLYEVRIFTTSGPLPGSPFSVKVIDTSAILPVGGWGTDNSGRVRAPSKIILDTSNAGPGTLECLLAGRHQRVETVAGRAVVTLTATEGVSGEQELELTYNGAIVAGAPRKALVTSGNTADRVTLAGRGLAHAAPHTPAVFTIDGSAAGPGAPEASLASPEGDFIAVSLTAAGPGLWRATYTPRRAGDHQLRVTWAGRLVKGCPLTVKVMAGSESGDASRVVCSGAGLAGGVVGREIRSWIDTRRAGPGELTAHCTGPNKVAYCELYEHGDGTFTLNVKPAEAGRHVLSVQFAGEHVPGSPFVLKVAGAPDPSKVRVYGPGVEPGVLATFQSRFLCDTRGAGAGQLTVRVRGPKGAFRVEMQRENQKDRTILCKFSPTEPGDYRVEVRWAGRHVPGSPFPVMIFDTQEELRRYMQANAA
ncbi:filamin-A [Bicyclus anynana]|uniref:Filamin-A n=2 Tax=Satyrini TaxID=127320 RepID=A0ABM3LE47_BICAN|nr:filamin-A [Bicyclus anynana]XP_052737341.1 filamin-A [Bicyclus anynana]